MLAAVMSGPNDLYATELPTPAPERGEVLVAVGANTLCGTDLRILRGEKTAGVEPPVVLGHETAGHVAAVGAGVDGYALGAPVVVVPIIPCRRCWECRHDLDNVCRNPRILGYAVHGGMADYILLPADAVAANCLLVAHENLPSEQLALTEPLSACVAGQTWCPVEPDDVVVVMGAGPIGLFHLQLARLAGARAVIVSEPSAGRRAHAERLGAAVVVDPATDDLAAAVDRVTEGVGADVTIICIGVPGLVNEALQISRKCGRVNAFAGFKGSGTSQVDANLIHYKQVLLTGSASSRRRDFEVAIRLIESGRVETASMITHRFGLGEVADALEVVGHGDALKVAVMPQLGR
jgi:L-iditol 2-dehydrogenase